MALQAGLAAAFDGRPVCGHWQRWSQRTEEPGPDDSYAPRRCCGNRKTGGVDPIVRPKSPEMPQKEFDSRYQLQGEIARGGMGAILKGATPIWAAIWRSRCCWISTRTSRRSIQRFIEEAQIGGQLQHPGIAPIYELGQFADKRPFFSMKLVKGETLVETAGRCAQTRPPTGASSSASSSRSARRWPTPTVAGVIHRDLKPANIMVGAFGEVQVMDWGLAKVLSAGGVADEKKAHDKQQGQSVIQTLRSDVGSDAPGTFGTYGSQTQMGSVMGTPGLHAAGAGAGRNRQPGRAGRRVRSGGDPVRNPDRQAAVCRRRRDAGVSAWPSAANWTTASRGSMPAGPTRI